MDGHGGCLGHWQLKFMPITSDEFRTTLGRFASGVTVVTCKDAEDKLWGLTVSAFCSVSMTPPMVLVCVSKTNGSHASFPECGAFVVNILDESQQNISNHFASPLPDKFSSVEYRLNEKGLPVLRSCLASLECLLRHTYDGGDHTILVGEIEKADVSDGKPLVYWQGRYQSLNGQGSF